MRESLTSVKSILALLGIFFVAINLRVPITSVGPVLPDIISDLGLSNVQAGLITTIPLLAFGTLSIFAPKFSEKLGLENVLGYAMLVLLAGIIIRVSGSITTLLLGAALIGVAIAMGNVLMPAFIKQRFPSHLGLVMGLFAVSMNLTGALGAGFSAQIGEISEYGWKASLGIWGVSAILGFLVWSFQLKKKKEGQNQKASLTEVLKNRLAWYITILMGLQSCLFYILITWLPVVLQDWGLSKEESGWMLSYVQFSQLPITFFGPILIGKLKDFRGIMLFITLVLLVGFLGLIIFKLEYAVFSVILMGTGTGLVFSLVMMLFVLKTNSSEVAGQLSGVAQSFGYLIAAITPPLFGFVFDLSGSWTTALWMLIPLTLLMSLFGYLSVKDEKKIGDFEK